MATGQSLLDIMEILNQELQLQSGEADVTRGLLALNISQDYFESLAAARKKVKGGQTGTVVTVASTETTAFPTGVLRIDRLQLLDATTSRPKSELRPLKRTGGHAVTSFWPYSLTTTGTGEPNAYWTNGRSIYWSPLPGGVYTFRWYGFQSATDITASGTFLYDDIVMLPIASFAARLLKSGVDDPAQDVAAVAQESFKSTLDILQTFDRDGAAGFEYEEVHNT
jgi:hypothetical protein